MKRISNCCTVVLLLFFWGCQSENTESAKEEKKEPGTKLPEKKENTEFLVKTLENHEFYSPVFQNYLPKAKGTLKMIPGTNAHFEGMITYADGSSDHIQFSGKKLVAKISPLAFNQNYHQQLSVYLFERQWHKDSVTAEIKNEDVSRYEIINPPLGDNWYLNAIQNDGKEEKIVASYLIKIPPVVYGTIFKELNPSADQNLLTNLYTAPESQKIIYNSLRKLGKFHEGVLASLNHLPFDNTMQWSNSIFVQKKQPKTLASLYESEFEFPHSDEDRSYDTSHIRIHSLYELYHIKSFSYKSAYPLEGGKDSTLEMQIDFKTRDNQPSIRFVIGGIVFSEVPRLKNDEMKQGLYLPLGFASYNKPAIKQESYVLMGNTSALWVDNSLGRNIDGVLLYFDKTQKSKMHIWIIGGDGTIPVGHYVTTLDALFQ